MRVLVGLFAGTAAAGLLAVVVVRTDVDPVRVTTGAAPTTAAAPTRPTATTSAPSTTTSTRPATTTTTTTTPPAPAGPGVLREGATGPAVADLQRRLVALGYWLGDVDGVYGASTAHAVVAFQKTASLARDGAAGPATLDRLASADRIPPRSTTGRVAEVDLTRQVVLIVSGGRVEWVFDASTGSEPGTTPTGRFAVYHEVDGYDEGPLGVLYRPKYFVRGVAVHGYPNVPPSPASHGCVRVTNPAMDWLWASGVLVTGTPVWVY